MYTRISQFNFQEHRLDEMVSRLDEIGKQLNSIDGMVETYVFWESSGSGSSIAIYRDQAAAEAASETIQSIWSGLMDLLTGPPTLSAYSHGWHLRS